MAAMSASESSVVRDFEPDNFANASIIASWLESLPDDQKLQCVHLLNPLVREVPSNSK